MAERNCTDCEWENKYKDVVTFWGCNKPAPQGLPDAFQLVPRTSPFVNCEGWEKRALSREEQIEAVARATLEALADTRYFHWNSLNMAHAALVLALALPKPKPLEPAHPTEAEMRRAVMEARWEVGTCCWWAPGNSAAVRTLTEAYARVMREKAVVFAGESAHN